MNEKHTAPSIRSPTTVNQSSADSRRVVEGLVARATELVRGHRDLGGTMNAILADLESTIGCDRALVWLLDDAEETLSTAYGRYDGNEWNPGWVQPATWATFTSALRDNAVSAAPREALDELGEIFDSLGTAPARHFLTGPIRFVDHTFGVFSLTRLSASQPFTESEVETFRAVAGLASIAVRMSFATDAEREHRHRTLQLGILTASLNQARTPEAVASALLRGVQRLLRLEHSSVALIHPAYADNVSIHLSEPLRHDGRRVVGGINPDDHPVERELRQTRRAISGERFRKLLELRPTAGPDNMHGLAAVPIRNGTRLDGVLYLWSPVAPSVPGFTELGSGDLEIAETLCAQTAVALERTRLQELAQQTAIEERTLAGVSSRLSAALTAEEMASTALGAISSMMPVRFGRVSVRESAEGRVEVLGKQPPDASANHLDRSLRLLEDWVELDVTGWSGPLSKWLGTERAPDEEIAGCHVVSWPVGTGEAMIGTLTIVRDGTSQFMAREIELVSHVCGQLALGLQRARSHHDAVVAREEAERYSGDITHLLHVSNLMAGQHTVDDLIESIGTGLASLVEFTTFELYRANDEQEHLELVERHSIDPDHQPQGNQVIYGRGAIGRAARLRRPAQGTRVDSTRSSQVLALPLITEGELLGVIGLTRAPGNPFTKSELSLLEIFSTRAAAGIGRAELVQRNRELYVGGIRALTSTVDAKDPHTRGHSTRVGRIARSIAEEMSLPHSDVEAVELAGLLHDIGKIGIPDAILQKPAPLDVEERAIMMGHTDLGAAILREAHTGALESLIPLVRHHHEWWDGRGYPGSLRGEEIPLGARIIGVADAFDTMTNDRPYRERASVSETWRIIEAGAGTQFAPDVVGALGRLLAGDSPAVRLHSDMQGETSPPKPTGEAPAENRPGQLGDLRSLGVLVGLARITSHMVDLTSLLEQALSLLAERLDLTLLLVMKSSDSRSGELEAVAHTRDGFRIVQCPRPDCLDLLLAGDLPASLDSIYHLAQEPVVRSVFGDTHNLGVVPLMTGSVPGGVLLFRPNADDRYWRSDLGVIEAISPHVTAAINVARMHEQAKEDALTDGLTGALNYRAFHRALDEHIRNDGPFAVLMFDVIGLKHLNDTVGHLSGDELLRRTVRVIGASVQQSSIIARIGGDEFGVLVKEGEYLRDPEATARRIGERMTREVGSRYEHDVLLRFGWASHPSEGRTPDELVHIADQRMYRQHPPPRNR